MTFRHFILSLTLCLAFCVRVDAQMPERHSIDSDIAALRNNWMPAFDYSYDDYLQYAPAGVMLGLKISGYEGRSEWGRMLVSDAFSAAIMAGTVNGMKYSIARMRPDGSRRNSFPSGHTATAFLTATMLHKEYGWKDPWLSIGGYTAAAVTGLSRILNNRHWLTDVIAGAGIGIGSVHLGYYLTDRIFGNRQLSSGYYRSEPFYDTTKKHYTAELVFGQRFILGADAYMDSGELPMRGGMAGVSTDIPLAPDKGLTGRASASSLTYSSSEVTTLYSIMGGGFYNFNFAKVMELQLKAMIGYATEYAGLTSGNMEAAVVGPDRLIGSGVCLGAGAGLSIIIADNFKVKLFTELESASLNRNLPWLNTLITGFGTGWFW